MYHQLEQRSCIECSRTFALIEQEQAYYAKISVPLPRHCPDCRFMRRLAERNARKLYYRKCSLTARKILSQYHEQQPFPVYCPEAWWSDTWDAEDYGQDYDSSRSFFEQLGELKCRVPAMALYVIGGTLENSDYTNCTGYLKNCYLIGESDYDEDCYYSNLLKRCQDVMDCSVCYDCQLCYQCIDCLNCYNLVYSQDCETCRDSIALFSCRSCSDCIACSNLYQRQYCIYNRQYSRDEYLRERETLGLSNFSSLQAFVKAARAFAALQPKRNVQCEHSESSIGNHLYHSKNAYYCFDSRDLEDCLYCAKLSLSVRDCVDYNSWGDKAELLYQCAGCGDNVYNLKFCSTCTTNCANLEYCIGCTQSSDLFACVGMKKKCFCILNRQFSQADYQSLRAQIIAAMSDAGDYGKFFPPELCSFGYNETIAMDYYPLTKEQALSRGYRWKEEEDRAVDVQTCEVPESIEQTGDSILTEVFGCAQCGRNYKIIAQELAFYRKMTLPVERACPDCRHRLRMAQRPPAQLREAGCSRCGKAMLSAVPESHAGAVYCEACYQAEMF